MFIYGILVGASITWTLSIWNERTYKKLLVMKSCKAYRTPEKINGQFYYIIPEKEYVGVNNDT